MIYIYIATILILVLVLFGSYRAYEKQEKEINGLKQTIIGFKQDKEEQQVKAEWMIEMLEADFRKTKKAHYCLGNVDALRWATGQIPDDSYWGWVMAKKIVNRRERAK